MVCGCWECFSQSKYTHCPQNKHISKMCPVKGDITIIYYTNCITLWWSVNLSHNCALNVWTVTFIKLPQLLIFRLIAIVIVCTGQDVYCDWLRHSQPPTHQVKQPIRDIWHLLILSYVSLRKTEYVSQSKFACCIRKSCPIVGDLASSPWRVQLYIY